VHLKDEALDRRVWRILWKRLLTCRKAEGVVNEFKSLLFD